jgi:hypothetical protein
VLFLEKHHEILADQVSSYNNKNKLLLGLLHRI